MPELSEEAARKRLEQAVSNFDWFTHFHEGSPKGFLQEHRALNAQLRVGDSLTIEVKSTTHSGRHGTDYPGVFFQHVLYRKGNPEGETIFGPLLYEED